MCEVRVTSDMVREMGGMEMMVMMPQDFSGKVEVELEGVSREKKVLNNVEMGYGSVSRSTVSIWVEVMAVADSAILEMRETRGMGVED